MNDAHRLIRAERIVAVNNVRRDAPLVGEHIAVPTTGAERRFPTWHFSMLNDLTRNAVIENTVRELDLAGKVVLEIGSGTGLIAILFAKYGAGHVYSCENNAQMYEIARRVIARSGYANKVTLFPLSCRELIVRRYLEEAPDIIFTETLDCGVVNEGFFQISEDVRSLARDHTIVLPQRIDQFGYLISSADIYALNHVDAPCGIDVSILNELNTKTYFPIHLADRRVQALTVIAPVRSYDYLNPDKRDAELVFRVQVDGVCHGLITWFEARFGRYVVSNDLHYRTHWHQAFHPLSKPVPVKAGTDCHGKLTQHGRVILERT